MKVKTLKESQFLNESIKVPKYRNMTKRGTTTLFYDEGIGAIEVTNINTNGLNREVRFSLPVSTGEEEVARICIYYGKLRGSATPGWMVSIYPYMSYSSRDSTNLTEEEAVELFDDIVSDVFKRFETDDAESFRDSLSVLNAAVKKYGLK